MTNVLISGASVAGPALAFWLREHGFRPTVVERAPSLREGGYKIDIRGAALEVVERMGLLEEVRRHSTDMQIARFVDAKGKQMATMSAQLFGGREGDDVEIMRGDLGAILYEATKDDVEYIFGDSIAALEETPDGIHVTFENGPARTFDLVVGADGLHSNVRALTFGEESEFVHDLGHHISIFTVPNHLGLDRTEMMHPAPGRSAGMYSTRQSADAKAMFLFVSPAGPYDRKDVNAQKKLLAETFAAQGWDVPRLLDSMWDAPDFYFDSISQVRMDRWSSGRVVLVGDAAYGPSPASGQGTSLSLVGAYVLAGSLAAAAGDHTAGFATYEEDMRHFVEENQKLAEGNLKGMVLKSAGQIRFQMGMLRLMPHLPGKDRMIRRVTEPIRKAATAITIRDY
ncbi:FAD-dependent monooxygenase [Planotetraspora phitsanulokensis]|uniref:FAD-dependent oxidoreductase n=1 Tax=Planotetraspora phitsanulokensis TaxID=575192 RepID=A0A8J3XJT9_9ACTN|nr:FAD-dependent monooxygenase [Planotetraspora phitsanulokensis]GII42411.1 FAD-dependent oxidoreductase [Planotetraspora phitsanulokensis]